MFDKYGYGYREGEARIGRTGYSDDKDIAYLPHSCDEWQIGDADNVRLLIADLQKILVELEKNTPTIVKDPPENQPFFSSITTTDKP